MRSPSIVPDAPGDIVSALTTALATIQGLVVYDDELKKWFVADEDDPLFVSVPGLIDHVRKVARANTQSETQGARSPARIGKFEQRKVARARAYQRYRMNPIHSEKSDSDLKALCGGRPVDNPYFDANDSWSDTNKRYLPTLKRSQAIRAIDEGLALIATGRFALSSGNIGQNL